MTYSEKLKDPRWQKKRLEILNRDKFKCRLCNSENFTLHIHHEKYGNNPWETKNKDLITLCEQCHSIVEYYKTQNFQSYPVKVFRNESSDFYFLSVLTVNKEKSRFAIFQFEYNKSEKIPVFMAGMYQDIFEAINKEIISWKKK